MNDSERREVLDGLFQPTKTLPPKLFYDERGSDLFDEITELPEYYPTRTELAILQDAAPDVAAIVGEGVRVVEIGSGSSTKTKILLDALSKPRQYVPIDISRAYLDGAQARLREEYPNLEVAPVLGDYTKPIKLPDAAGASSTLGFFPGSTIGNFEPKDAVAFLQRIAAMIGAGGRLLLGTDLPKDPVRLHAAYNDARGVTAAFNLNVLARINRELDANFDLTRFRHYAFYEPVRARIEMHLVSLAPQTVTIDGTALTLALGETIKTEHSYKYSPEELTAMASAAGLSVERRWTDVESLFSVTLLRKSDSRAQ